MRARCARACCRRDSGAGPGAHAGALFPADQGLIAQMLETILAKVETLVTLQPDAPSPEEAWIARLTAAHEAAHPTQTAEEPDTPQRQTPQGCP